MKKFAHIVLAVLLAVAAVFPFAACQSVPKLETPSNFRIDDDYRLTWDVVSNSSGYLVYIKSITENKDLEPKTARREYIVLSGSDYPEGDYEICVQALSVSSVYEDSELSAPLMFHKAYESGCVYEPINNGSEYAIIGIGSSGAEVLIEDAYRGKPVTKIGNSAFYNDRALVKITLGKNIVTIDDNAFYSCKSLQTIEMPETVTTIGKDVFNSCVSLKSFRFPDGVTTVGDGVFNFCTALESVDTNNVKALTENMFNACSALKSFTVSDNIESIRKTAFNKATALKEVTFGSGLKSIGERAFFGCSALDTLNFSEQSSLASVGPYAFTNCNFTSLSLPEGVTQIGDRAFMGNGELKEVSLPNSLTDLGTLVFYNTKIYKDASEANEVFYYADNWLAGLTNLEDERIVNVNLPVPEGVSPEGYYFTRDDIVGICAQAFLGCKKLGDVKLPATVKYLNAYAFAYCDMLWRFDSENTALETIGSGAFASDKSLRNILFGNKLKSIETYAFYNCENFDYRNQEVGRLIPESVNHIGQGAFEGTVLMTHADDYGVIYADNWVLGCTGAYEIVYDDDKNFKGFKRPEGGTKSSIELKATTRGIADYGFFLCMDLETITNTQNVRYLGSGAFAMCKELANYTFNADMDAIPAFSFYNCMKLVPGKFPDELVSIGRSAFYSCLRIDKVSMPNSLQSLGYFSFGNCTFLSSVRFGKNLTTIEPYAFYGCQGLDNVTIPGNIKTIGNSAFSRCVRLENLVIEEGVETIGNFAFYKNYSLSSIKIPNSVTSIGKYAFFDCRFASSLEIGGATHIGRFAFANLYYTKQVNLPDTLQFIDTGAFLYLGKDSLIPMTEEELKKAIDYAIEELFYDPFEDFFGSSSFEDFFDPDKEEKNDGPWVPPENFLQDATMPSYVIPGKPQRIDTHAFYGCFYATFYMEAENMSGVWGTGWNSSKRPVVWGVTLSEDKSYVISLTIKETTFENSEALFGITAPYRAGYRFLGWAVEEGGEVVYAAGEIANAPVGATLYAIYELES